MMCIFLMSWLSNIYFRLSKIAQMFTSITVYVKCNITWNGYMERSYRNTMHDSKRVCLKEVIIILE